MFYINQFFKIFKKNSSKGLFFVIVSMSFVFVLGNWTILKEKIVELYPDYMKGPSFYALISEKEDYLSIQRKLISLPGISSVKILEKEIVKKQTEKIIANFELNSGELEGLNYIGFEIMFDKSINERGQELIRNYLTKLAGENITLGKIHALPEKDNIRAVMDFINGGGVWPLSLIFGILWILSLAIFKKEVIKSSYLIEQYQRKKSVEFKILFSGIICVYTLSAGLTAVAPSPEWINVVIIGLFFMIAIAISGGKRRWES